MELKHSAWSVLAVVVLVLAGCGGGDDALQEVVRMQSGQLQVLGAVDPGADQCRSLLGDGWGRAEKRTKGGQHAWTLQPVVTVTLPGIEPADGRFVLKGYGLADGREIRTLTLVVNGHELVPQPLPSRSMQVSFKVAAK